MRIVFCLATSWLFLSAGPLLAQDQKPQAEPAPSGEATRNWPGPVVHGHHRQPTEEEIEARERAEGLSSKSIEEQSREEDKVIDDLYQELRQPMKPPN
jgi:hypothetical protein